MPPRRHASVVSLSVSPDDGSCPEAVPMRRIPDILISHTVFGCCVCVSVELAIFFCFRWVFSIKDLGAAGVFLCMGEVSLFPLNKAV